MKRLPLPTLLLTLVGFGLLLLSGSFHHSVAEARHEVAPRVQTPDEATPLVAMTTVAFGGFRGLVADALWVRASKLLETGQYFELAQLAKWITQLSPRTPEVWTFQGWNLAYNVGFLFPEPADRLRWVESGLDLLREDALHHNPRSPKIHWEIGWFFQHKYGFPSDNAQPYYAQSLSDQIEDLFGGPTPPYDRWLSLPQTTSAWLQPTTHRELAKKIRDLGLDPFSPEIHAKLPSPQLAAAFQAYPEAALSLRDFVKRRQFEDIFHMDLTFMRDLEDRIGPIDWRRPLNHSLYWSTKGLEHPGEERTRIQLARMAIQSTAALMRDGGMLSSEERERGLVAPRPDLIPHLDALHQVELAKRPDVSSVTDSYRQFLMEATLLLFTTGDIVGARAQYKKLSAVDPEATDTDTAFDQFVLSALSHYPPSTFLPERRAAYLAGLQTQARLLSLQGNTQRAELFRRLATSVEKVL